MVYHGPSQGCRTCKQRRKKCDETRPLCLRCCKSNRTCRGYEYNGELRILRYAMGATPPLSQKQKQDAPPVPYQSIARKCTLPPRVCGPTTDGMLQDPPKPDISDVEVHNHALRSFIYEYCVSSTNQSLSRGFLDGLEPMLRRLGPQSNLEKACKTVAYASHSIKLRRPSLEAQAKSWYGELLGHLVEAMANPATARTSETVMISILLGLYEIILADEIRLGNHNSHARGVAALLEIEGSPLNILGAVHLIKSGHPLILKGKIQNYGMFFSPCKYDHVDRSLDDLMLVFGSLWKRAEHFFAKSPTKGDEIRILKEEAITLNEAFITWQKTRVEVIKPKAIGQVSQERALASNFGVGYWPGTVDTYFDLYTAGVWNISRTARLLLTSLTLRLSRIQGGELDHSHELEDALRLVEEMIASIHYHITEDIHVFLQNKETSTEITNPGRSVGGLLLMHPIYIASRLSIVPSNIRVYLKECLAWIGMQMGIGQAYLFAKAQAIDEEYFAGGSMIVWAGLLV